MLSLRSIIVPLAAFTAFVALAAVVPARAAAYVLCIHESPAQLSARTDPQAGPAYWRAFSAFGDELKAAGVLRGGSAFDAAVPAKSVKPGQPAAAAKVVAPTAQAFSGYFVIEVAGEADALAWAARVPAPDGRVEVRALLPMMAP